MPRDLPQVGGRKPLNSRQLERIEGLAWARGWRAGMAAARELGAKGSS